MLRTLHSSHFLVRETVLVRHLIIRKNFDTPKSTSGQNLILITLVVNQDLGLLCVNSNPFYEMKTQDLTQPRQQYVLKFNS